jgi:hypothetical protein
MNPIMAKNNTIVSLHLDDEECGSDDLLPTVSSMEMTPRATIRLPPPHAVKCQIGLHELIVLPSKLLEGGVWHQVEGNATIDEHLGVWLPVEVTLNVERLQVLA